MKEGSLHTRKSRALYNAVLVGVKVARLELDEKHYTTIKGYDHSNMSISKYEMGEAMVGS